MSEHFVTLFSAEFMVLGLALYDSLGEHTESFCLWVLCMDEDTEKFLKTLDLPHLRVIPLREIETPGLLEVKVTRTVGEYCWTLTPFSVAAVFAADASVTQVTYLDADLGFFADPHLLLNELRDSGRDVLITEHAYDPSYDQSASSGRFCVQFVTFKRTPGGLKVNSWWQERCLEWCYNRLEDGKFGDQKYLDQWPSLFADEVQIVAAKHLTLAPWNVAYFNREHQSAPVFYHFHGLRFLSKTKVRLFDGYRVGPGGLKLYQEHILRIQAILAQHHGLKLPLEATADGPFNKTRRLVRQLRGTRAVSSLDR